MSANIERLNFYEREYLRSFDFIAEQNYHMEMRRRLNMALHLWGIVDGLDVQKGQLVPGAPEQFYVSRGMAIDAFGREILLFTDYALSEDDLTQNRITTSGTYKLWIVYERRLDIPPSPGYRICDIKDQYTRWKESFRISIADNPSFATKPGVVDDLSDDPEKNPWPVRLGTITVSFDSSGKLTITGASPTERIYIGLRTQRIVSPVDATKNFPILSKNVPLAPPTSIGIEANLFAEQNLIIGEDFEVKTADIIPTPKPVAPVTFPNPKGNLKIAGDLFLSGNFYTDVDGKWLGTSENMKRLVPDILVGFRKITIPTPNATDPSNDTEKFSVTSKLDSVGKADIMASIASVQWDEKSKADNIINTAGATGKMLFQIIKANAKPSASPPNNCDVEVTWAVGPTAKIGTQFESPIISMTISYMIICYP